MLRTITIAALLASGAMLTGHARANTRDAAPQLFMLQVNRDTTPGSIIPAIVSAGRDQLASVCEYTPEAAVRIENPMTPGDYEDVPCSEILGGDEPTGEARAPLTSNPGNERIGEAQQHLTPLGPLLCGLAGLIATTGAGKRCTDWRGPNSQVCSVGTFAYGLAWVAARTAAASAFGIR